MLKLLNRDISFLSFNLRVSDESLKNITLSEKVLFQGITYSNLDEFLAVRYPAAVEYSTEDELEELRNKIIGHYQTLGDRFSDFNDKYKFIRSFFKLDKDERKYADQYFMQNVYPGLQAISFNPDKQLNLHNGFYVLVIYELNGDQKVGYIEIPKMIDRFIAIPNKHYVIRVEELIQNRIKSIFLNGEHYTVAPFTVNRSAEVYIQSDQYADPYQLIQKTLREREKAWITCCEIGSKKKQVIKLLKRVLPNLGNTILLPTEFVHLQDLKKFPNIFTEDEQPKKFTPVNTFPYSNLFDYIKKQDRLCFHPYESYDGSMVRLLEEASEDPDVVSIKISLYRVSDNSKIIRSLVKAADKGKLVTVLVELKARFDEHHNMEISNILREGGVRIVYTKPDIKTHAKVCLITRKEKKGLRIYSHVGTGNYSESNSKQYTDYSYFSADQELGRDLTQFFNLLCSEQGTFKSKRIVYAPYNMRDEINSLIDEQIKLAKKGKKARIIAKCNSLSDDKIAEKLASAADAGVKVILIIRSACILEPRKSLKIYSIVGKFLEHSRLYLFGTGNNPDVLIGSSDLMTRNLSGRNELLLRVEDNDIKKRLMKHMNMYLKDNTNRRKIQKGYHYRDIHPDKKEKPYTCQMEFIKEAKKLAE